MKTPVKNLYDIVLALDRKNSSHLGYFYNLLGDIGNASVEPALAQGLLNWIGLGRFEANINNAAQNFSNLSDEINRTTNSVKETLSSVKPFLVPTGHIHDPPPQSPEGGHDFESAQKEANDNKPNSYKVHQTLEPMRMLINIKLFFALTSWFDRFLLFINTWFDKIVSMTMMEEVRMIGLRILHKDQQYRCDRAREEEIQAEKIRKKAEKTHNARTETVVSEPCESQSLETDSAFVAAIFSVIGLAMVGKAPENSTTHKFMKKMSDKSRMLYSFSQGIKGSIELYSYFVSAIKNSIVYFQNYMGYTLPGIDSNQIISWFTEVMDLSSSEDVLLRLTYDENLRMRIRYLRDQCDKIAACLSKTRSNSVINSQFSKAQTALMKLCLRMDHISMNYGVRKDPFCFCITGLPGAGKSYLQYEIINLLAEREGIPFYQRTYAKNQAEKYWPLYAHQYAVQYDDFGQIREGTQVDPYSEFITIKSNCQCSLQMADIDDKGRNFTSKLIAMTTNIAYPRPNSITCHEALWRRRDVLVEMIRSQEFGKPGDFSYCKFNLLDPVVPGNTIKSDLTYNELCQHIINLYDKHGEQQDVAVNYLTRHSRNEDQLVADSMEAAFAQTSSQSTSVANILSEPSKLHRQFIAAHYLRFKYLPGLPRLHLFKSQYDLVHESPVILLKDVLGDESMWDCITDYLMLGLPSEVHKVPDEIFQLSSIVLYGDVHYSSQEEITPDFSDSNEEVLSQFDRNRCLEFVEKAEQQCAEDCIFENNLTFTEYCDLLFNIIPILQDPNFDIQAILNQDNLRIALGRYVWNKAITPEQVGLFLNSKKGRTACLYAYKRRMINTMVITGKMNLRDAYIQADKFLLDDIPGTWLGDLMMCDHEEAHKFRDEILGIPNFLSLKLEEFQIKHPYIYAVLVAIGIYLTIKGAMLLISSLFDSTEFQGYSSGQTPKAPVLFPKVVMSARAVAQSSDFDNNAESITIHRVLPNLAEMVITTGQKTYRQSCYRIKGRMFLVNRHTFYQCQEESEITLRLGQTEFTFRFDAQKWAVHPAGDLAMFQAPLSVPLGKDNSSLFITDADLSYLQSCDSNHYCHFNDREFSWQSIYKPVDRLYEITDGIFIREGWSSTYNTLKGMCGAVMVINNNNSPRKLAGIHSARSTITHKSITQLVTQEMIKELLSQFDVLVDNTSVPDFIEVAEDQSLVELRGNFTNLGISKLHAGSGSKTHIVASPIHEHIFPKVTEPAVFTSRDKRLDFPVDPLAMAISKYGSPSKPFRKGTLDYVAENVKQITQSFEVARTPRILTFEQSYQGIPSLKYFDPIDMKSSPGLPYNKERPVNKSGKHALFEIDQDGIYHCISKDLEKRTCERLDSYRKGERYPSLWTDCLKDERRPLAKIRQGKTRSFCMAPLDYTLVCRMFLLDFCAAFYNSRLTFFSAVGIDVRSAEWTFLFNRLNSVSPIGIAGDYSSWDGSCKPEVFEKVLEVINDWYDDGEDNARVRAMIFDEMVHTKSLARNQMYQKHQGMPSGHVLTVVVNTIINAIYLRCAWVDLAHKTNPSFRPLSQFHRLVADSIYGDDNILAIDPSVITWFNQITISNYFSQYGISYTDATKNAILNEYDFIANLTFLKCGFKPHQYNRQFLLAPIATDTIQELLNWVSDSNDPTDQLLSNYYDALVFAYHHGKSYFVNFKQQAEKAMRGIGIEFPCYQYSDFDSSFLDAFL
jgi:hypothetical protein